MDTLSSPSRQADALIEGSSHGLGSKLKLVAKSQVKLWKVFVFAMFIAGFSAALTWAVSSTYFENPGGGLEFSSSEAKTLRCDPDTGEGCSGGGGGGGGGQTAQCELIDGNGRNGNFRFVILVEGKRGEDETEVRKGVKEMIERGYRDIATVRPYKDRINTYYKYLPENSLRCTKDGDYMDCDRTLAEERARTYCGGLDEVAVIPLRFRYLWGGSTLENDKYINFLVKNFFIGGILKSLTNDSSVFKEVTVVLSRFDPHSFWHELGHSFAGETDYFEFENVKRISGCPSNNLACKCAKAGFASKMCAVYDYDFKSNGLGDSRNSVDAWRMVRQLNKKCSMQLHDYGGKLPPFPNPNTSGNTEKVRYAVQPGDDCHVTLEIANNQGQLVRVYATETVPDPNNYMAKTSNGLGYNFFEWDLKNADGVPVATGVYHARVCASNCLESKFTVIR